MPLQPPLRDAKKEVIAHDHSGIASSDAVIRRISERQVITDKAGQRRISSMAFKTSNPNEGMSVDLEALILEANLDPRTYVTTPRWIGSVRLLVKDLRDEDLKVGFDPLPENPYHGQVWGVFDKSKPKRLQGKAAWYVAIEGVLAASG